MADSVWHVTPMDPSGVFIRKGPGVNHGAVASSFIGEALEVIGSDSEDGQDKVGKHGEWLNVRNRNAVEGWVAAWVVQTATVKAPAAPKPVLLHTTFSKGLNVRSGPGFEFDIVGSIEVDEIAEAIDAPRVVFNRLQKPGEWLQVKTEEGDLGWGAAWLLDEWWEGKFNKETPDPGDPAEKTYYVWPQGHAMVGIHGPADPGAWPWDGGAIKVIKNAKIKAVKVLTGGDVHTVIDGLHDAGVEFIMARLFAKFPEKRSVKSFVEEVTDSGLQLYNKGIRYFEVHNEPNLHHNDGPEGMWVMWDNGKEFGDFLLEAIDMLRKEFPKDAQFGWPGISPGQAISFPNGVPLRYEADKFLDEADFALRDVDFICSHAYWTHDYRTAVEEVRWYCETFPDKLIFVTEFSNPTHTNKDDKGKQYLDFYSACRSLPANLGALFSYLLSSSGGFEHETWKGSTIPAKIGQRGW